MELLASAARSAGGWPSGNKVASSIATRRLKAQSPRSDKGLDASGRGRRHRPAGVDVAIASVRQEFGPIHIAVTSAGVTPSSRSPISSNMEPDAGHQSDRSLQLRAGGGSRHDRRHWGRVVTISSAAGQSAAPGQADYVASKGGIIALTKALADEFAPNGITVNTIPPGLVDTPMARSAEAQARCRPGRSRTDDAAETGWYQRSIAAACDFLCSEDAGYITGRNQYQRRDVHVTLRTQLRIHLTKEFGHG